MKDRKTYKWTGTDDAQRIDAATIAFEADQLQAVGSSTTPDYALSWQLTTGGEWITQELRVSVQGFGWGRSLTLSRDESGNWFSQAECFGEIDLPEPGIQASTELNDALDCDLGLCPVTNTMPILRLAAHQFPVEPTNFVMAWVEVPSLRVLRSNQSYASASPENGTSRVSYSSLDSDFHAQLTVDGSGVVIDYEGLCARS